MRNALLTLLSVAALATLSACGRESKVATQQVNRSCPPSQNIAGTAGTECTQPQNCTEFCCICPSNDKQFAVAACIEGRCGQRNESCEEALAQNPALCQG